MKIISYNVNGIRAAQKKGWEEWVAKEQFDIVCIQENKAQPEQVDFSLLQDLGYQAYWHSAEKKGYSGVTTLTKQPVDQVSHGISIPEYDREGRVLRTDVGDITILNCYFPSGTTGDIRQEVKMRFLEDIYTFVDSLLQKRPKLIVCGDYNIAHQEIDIHDPVRNKKTSGFLPEERAWLTKWFSMGFTDAFRFCHPDKVEYSWWSYRAAARQRNKGWRLDYHSVSTDLQDQIKEARQLTEVVHSDHCPVLLELTL